MISLILALILIPQVNTYGASDLTKETIQKIECAADACVVAPLGMIQFSDETLEDSESEGLFPIRRPQPAPTPPSRQPDTRPDTQPDVSGDYMFPFLGRLFWRILGMPAVQIILTIGGLALLSQTVFKAIYGPAWMAAFLEDVITQVAGIFTGIVSGFKNAINKGSNDEELDEELADDEEWVYEDDE